MNSFYSNEELKQLGLKSFGKNVLISKKCSIYGADKISIGNNVRIDDFCILSGKIVIGNYVHISAYSALYAGGGRIKAYILKIMLVFQLDAQYGEKAMIFQVII